MFRTLLPTGKPSSLPTLERLEDRCTPALIVNTPLDVSDPNDTLLSLREAIVIANDTPEDTIRFARSAFRTDDTINLDPNLGQLQITDDLRIVGLGANKLTVSGDNMRRVFAVLPAGLADDPFVTPTLAQVATSPTVSIERLTIANGLATNALGYPLDGPGFAFGGGLYNLGGDVSLHRVVMKDNQALGAITAGGAVANEFGGRLTITRSHFNDNTSDGALIGVGGAITSDLGAVVEGTTGQPDVQISKSSFVGNTARALFGHTLDNATSERLAFSGLGAGGAILNVTGLMSVDDSYFRDNQAIGGSTPSLIEDTTALFGGPGFGGAINSSNVSPFGAAESRLVVTRSHFVANSATGGDGGATGLAGGEGAGGAILIANGGEAYLSRNWFEGNSASGGTGGTDAPGGNATGGAVGVNSGGDVTLTRSTLKRNLAEGGSGTGDGAGGNGRGGALGLSAVDLGGYLPDAPTATVYRSNFLLNEAEGGSGSTGGDGQGGGLAVEAGSADVVVSDFFFNQAFGGDGTVDGGNGQGGGVYNGPDGDTTIRRSAVFFNEAVRGVGDTGSDGVGQGGGLYNATGGTLDIDFLTLLLTKRNSASDAGNNIFGTIS